MHWLELKIPPPLLFLLTAGLMWLASGLVPAVQVPFGFRVPIAVVVACLGVAIDLAAIFAFRRVRTTVNPMRPNAVSTLVTSGVFGISRNPMYLGLLLYLLAWAVQLSNGLALALVPLFVLYMNRFQIGPEERALASRFGPAYAAYRQRVRRWL